MNHPMQQAELALQRLGIKHAPIQAFGEDDKIAGLDGRFVCALDPPGPYYILGFENNPSDLSSPNREKIQVLFWRCEETYGAIADVIGWEVEKIERLPVIGKEADKYPDPVTSAIFVQRSS